MRVSLLNPMTEIYKSMKVLQKDLLMYQHPVFFFLYVTSFSLMSDRHWMKKCSFSKRNEERIIGEQEDIDRYTL